MYGERSVAKCIERQCTQKPAAFAATVVPVHLQPGSTLHMAFAAYSLSIQSVYIHWCKWDHRVCCSLVISQCSLTMQGYSLARSQCRWVWCSVWLVKQTLSQSNVSNPSTGQIATLIPVDTLMKHSPRTPLAETKPQSAAPHDVDPHWIVRLQHCNFDKHHLSKGLQPYR